MILFAVVLLLSTEVWGHGHGDDQTSGSCDEFDIVRQELITRGGVATPAGSNANHEPVLTTIGDTVKVTIGINGTHHPQMGGTNPKKVHFIEYIYVVDQSNNIIAFKRFVPENRDVWEKTELVFDVTEGVTTLQAFSYCNVHGLFASEIMEVKGGRGSAECNQLTCVKTSCSLLDTLMTEAFRKVGGAEAAELITLNITTDTVGVTLHGIDLLPGIAYADSIFFVSQKSQSPIAGSLLKGTPKWHSQMLPHHTIDGIDNIDLFILYFKQDGHPVLVKNTKSFLPSAVCSPEYGGPCAAQYRLGLASHSHKEKCFSEAEVIKKNALRIPRTGAESSHTPTVTFDGNVVTALVDHSFHWNNDPSKLHYIDFMWAEDENNVIIAMESWVSNLTFTLPQGINRIKVFASCNRHGVHSSEVITVPGEVINSTSDTTPVVGQQPDLSDVLSYCRPSLEHPFSYFGGEHLCGDQLLKMLYADGVVFNNLVFNGKTASKLSTDITPTIEFGSFGEGNAIVRFPSQELCVDATGGYSVRNVVVVDQHLNVIAGTRYVGVERNPQLVFVVPKGTNSLTVRVVYNEHGLWVSRPTKVTTSCSVDLGYGCSLHTVIGSEGDNDDGDVVVDVTDDDDDDDAGGTTCVPSSLSGYSCMAPSGDASIHWNLTNPTLALALEIHHPVSGYIAFAFPERNGKMAPADSLIAATPADDLFGYRVLDDPDRVVFDESVLSRLEILNYSMTVVNGNPLLEITRHTGSFDPLNTFINIAWSDSNPDIQTHHDHRYSYAFDFINVKVASEVNEIYYYIHAILMMLGFGVFIPVAVVTKYRMRKESVQKPQTAVYTHAVNALIGVLCIGIGFFMKTGFSEHSGNDVATHSTLGYLIFFLVMAMPLFVCFSNFPFVDGERTVFREYIGSLHRYIGRAILVLAVIQTLTGSVQMYKISPPTSVLIVIVMLVSVGVVVFTAVLPSLREYYPIRSHDVDSELESKHQSNDFTSAVDNVDVDDQEIENA